MNNDEQINLLYFISYWLDNCLQTGMLLMTKMNSNKDGTLMATIY
jgi:hypothetical protein